MKHNATVVLAFFQSHGIPVPLAEHKFHESRRWRFDFAWKPHTKEIRGHIFEIGALALEIEGGVWIGGRHNSGAGFVKDMEKYNEAACLGWRIVRCQPRELLTAKMADTIKRALCLG
jgi:hypothetical protein